MPITPKHYLLVSLGATILTACASSLSQVEACPNPNLPCASAAGSVIAMSDDSGIMQMVGNDAAKKFNEIFGYPVPQTVIVPTGFVSAETSANLKANGFKLIMPWISEEDRLKLGESSIREQIEAQTKDLPAELRKAAQQQVMAQINISAISKTEAEQAGALSHELSHRWFIATFKKEDEVAKGHAYGGWAPDWLDETAAVLLENETLKEPRRSHFYNLRADQRIPLSEFLIMDHPAAGALDKPGLSFAKDDRLEALNLTGKGVEIVSSMRTFTGEEGQAIRKALGGDRVTTFYAQVLIFSEYLTARAGGTSVLPNIAEELAAGKSMSGWLADNRFGLPNTVSELQNDWTAWIQESGT